MLRNVPIRRKLVYVIMAASAAALLVGNVAMFAFEAVRFRRQMTADLVALATVIAENTSAALQFDDRAAAEDTLLTLRARPEIRAAALYRADGTPVVEYPAPGAAASGPEPPRGPAAGGPRVIAGDGTISVLRPVELEGRRIGTLMLQSDTGPLRERLRTQALTGLLVLGGALLVALLVSARLQRLISRPILELAETADRIARGPDFSLRARRHGNDETGRLVDAFNAMLGGIAQRDAALHAAKDELERRVAERTAELARRNEDLARSNRELDDFAYIASHDLKEPLRGIHNYAGFLLEDYRERLGEDGRQKLETLARLTRRMDALLDSLLYYSRVGRVDLAIGDVDLNAVVAGVVDSLHISLEEYGVRVRIPGRLPVVRCDEARIGEVFRNLVANAMRFNDKSERWIEIGTLPPPEGRQALVYVRDNGIGIPEKHYEAVFRIFKRLHGRERFGGGTGAGLTIVKKIVERHGGDVWIESRVGEGTTFFVAL